MKIVVNNDKTKNRDILFTRSPWTGKMELYIDGVAATKISRTQYKFGSDEEQENFTIRGNEFRGIELQTDLGKITILEKISIVETILAFILIFGMAILGGAIGGAIGAIGSYILLIAYRNMKNLLVKGFLTILVYFTAFSLWYVIAIEILKLADSI